MEMNDRTQKLGLSSEKHRAFQAINSVVLNFSPDVKIHGRRILLSSHEYKAPPEGLVEDGR